MTTTREIIANVREMLWLCWEDTDAPMITVDTAFLKFLTDELDRALDNPV